MDRNEPIPVRAYSPSAARASTNASTARFTSSVECAADSCTRMRAAPCGTTGYENPITYTPRSRSSSAIRPAFAASPIMTGAMAWSPGRMSKPSSVIRVRKSAVLALSRSRRSPADSSRSMTFSEAAAMTGARELEKRYGRDRWRSSATISARAAT